MTKRLAMYRPKRLELVEVEWSDALYDGEHDGTPESFDGRLAVLVNVGYFAKMTRESVVLVSCQQPSNGTVRWFVTIPRVNVRAIHPCERKQNGAQ